MDLGSILYVPLKLLAYIQDVEGDYFSKITWWSIINQGCQTGQENVAANIEFQYFRWLIELSGICRISRKTVRS